MRKTPVPEPGHTPSEASKKRVADHLKGLATKVDRSDEYRTETMDAASVLAKAARAVELNQVRTTWDWICSQIASDWIGGIEPGGVAALAPEQAIQLAGPGAPLVAEFVAVPLGKIFDMHPATATCWARDIAELGFRLPLVFARVLAGEVSLRGTRKLAKLTLEYSLACVTAIDEYLAEHMHGLSFVKIQHCVEQYAATFGEYTENVNPLQLGVYPEYGISPDGSKEVFIRGMAPEIDRFLDTIKLISQKLRQRGDTRENDEIRAAAIGILAEPAIAMQLLQEDEESGELNPLDYSEALASRIYNLYVHLTPEQLRNMTGQADNDADGGDERADIVQVEGNANHVFKAAVRDWITGGKDAGAVLGGMEHVRISVRPVIDLREPTETRGYVPNTATREHALLEYEQCAHPRCTRKARKCDLDHITPYDHANPTNGGPTSTENLQPLCRFHHRYKTHKGA